MSDVAEKVKKIIAEHLGIDDMEKITEDAKFIDDLGADSLDTVEPVSYTHLTLPTICSV